VAIDLLSQVFQLGLGVEVGSRSAANLGDEVWGQADESWMLDESLR